MTRSDAHNASGWRIEAAVATWVVPGLGHFLLGERRRAVTLTVSICVLWLTGLAIGGIGVCDHREHTAWFMGQAMLAPTLVADYWHQRLKATSADRSAVGDRPRYEPSYGQVKEQGILFTALAGLLNLLAILDVAYRGPERHAPLGSTNDLEQTGGSR